MVCDWRRRQAAAAAAGSSGGGGGGGDSLREPYLNPDTPGIGSNATVDAKLARLQ